MSDISQDGSYVTGQLLIAMPGMRDERFAKSVIYMCAHTEEGAMGLELNQRLDSLTFAELISQLELDEKHLSRDVPVHFGGPVESGRGFVLHTSDYQQDATLEVVNGVALTATVEILKAIAQGKGPQKSLLAFGDSGWGPCQLDMEIRAIGCLEWPSYSEIIFDI